LDIWKAKNAGEEGEAREELKPMDADRIRFQTYTVVDRYLALKEKYRAI
jgi:hypothetical protein